MIKNLKIIATTLTLLISFIIFLSSVMGTSSADAAEPNLTADAAVLIDAETGQIYYAKNADKQRAPASLTKIMTAVLAIELGRTQDIVTISKRAENIYVGSQIDLKEGEKIYLGELIKAALICSANDSTVAIAEHVGLTHDNFVKLMNEKALALGALNTNFVNTNGYSVPNHYSTAYDLAKITRYALQNAAFAKLVRTKETTIHWQDSEREKEVRNTNRLLKNDYPGVDGVKTGTTARAGNCLIASATRNNRQLIAVVLHSRSRYNDAAKLLEYGFKFNECCVFEKGEIFGKVTVNGGSKKSVPIVAKEDLKVQLPAEPENINLKIHLPEKITAPVKKGQQVGRAAVVFNNCEIGEIPLTAAENVGEKSKVLKLWERLTQ